MIKASDTIELCSKSETKMIKQLATTRGLSSPLSPLSLHPSLLQWAYPIPHIWHISPLSERRTLSLLSRSHTTTQGNYTGATSEREYRIWRHFESKSVTAAFSWEDPCTHHSSYTASIKGGVHPLLEKDVFVTDNFFYCIVFPTQNEKSKKDTGAFETVTSSTAAAFGAKKVKEIVTSNATERKKPNNIILPASVRLSIKTADLASGDLSSASEQTVTDEPMDQKTITEAASAAAASTGSALVPKRSAKGSQRDKKHTVRGRIESFRSEDLQEV